MRGRIGLAVFAAVLAIPASSQAAVTIGSKLAGTPGTLNCDVTQLCTVAQAKLATALQAPGGLSAPSDGVVTRFRVKSGPTSTKPVFLRVIRLTPPNDPNLTATGVRTSAGFTPPPSSISPDFPVRLPILAGDRIALDVGPGATNDLLVVPGGGTDSIGFWGVSGFGGLPLGDGDTPRHPDTFAAPRLLMLQADIEPDADGDRFGDETQDLCPTDPTTHAACPPTAVAPIVTPPATQLGTQPVTGPTTLPATKKCKRKNHRAAGSAKKKRCRKQRR